MSKVQNMQMQFSNTLSLDVCAVIYYYMYNYARQIQRHMAGLLTIGLFVQVKTTKNIK